MPRHLCIVRSERKNRRSRYNLVRSGLAFGAPSTRKDLLVQDQSVDPVLTAVFDDVEPSVAPFSLYRCASAMCKTRQVPERRGAHRSNIGPGPCAKSI